MVTTRLITTLRRLAFFLVVLLGVGSVPARAQTGRTFSACYVPTVGAIYLIKIGNLPAACLAASHVEISWTELGDGTVTTVKLADGSVTTAKLADGSVTSAKLGSDVGSTIVGDGSVTTSKIADGAVTDVKLAERYLLANGTRALAANLSAGGFRITNLPAPTEPGDAVNAATAVLVGGQAGGDLAATYPDPAVVRLQGRAVAPGAPETGQVLTWSGTQWQPTTPVTGVTDHGNLTGLTDDDHQQYLLVEGTRVSLNGFAVSGTTELTGTLPTSGPGTRLMWYPRKAAFRAGGVTGTHWDDANLGFYSTAIGLNTTASGYSSTAMGYLTTASSTGSTAIGSWTTATALYSTAMGVETTASGARSTAMGDNTTASGSSSTAMGERTTASGSGSTALGQETTASAGGSTAIGRATTASGLASTAMGQETTASGTYSTAIGTLASTNAMTGSFVYGDASTLNPFTDVHATAENSFVVRAQRVWFGKSGDQVATTDRYIETSTGAYLSDGGAWTNASDADRKENFREQDPEGVLEKVAQLPIRNWNYRDEDPGVRHLGPTAQDFFAAFGLGDSDKTISTVDIAGVALLAIQALEQRTREVTALHQRVVTLEGEHESLRAELAALRAEIETRLAGLEVVAQQAKPIARQ